jgi:PAS domain S-box-containing protein
LSYAAALGALAAATGLRMALSPVLGAEMPLVFFFPPVILAALLGGMQLGLGATALGCVIGWLLFVAPAAGASGAQAADWVRVGLFLCAGGVTSWLINSRRRGWQTAALAVEHLRDSEARLMEALRIARLGVWEYDAAAAVVRLDGRSKEIIGCEETEIAGAALSALIEGSDRSRVEREVREAFAAGGPGVYEAEHPIKRAEGEAVWVALRGHAIPAGGGAHGGPARVVGTVMNVTERKQAELERDRLVDLLREEHARSVEILESIGDAFYAVDADFRFTYLNRRAEQWWGRRSEDLLGKVVWAEFPQVVGQKPYQMQLQVMRERRPVQIEFRSGLVGRWMDLSIYPAAGGGLSCYFRDIDERKRSEQALREADRRKDEFLAVLGHELRNPLAPLRTGLELLGLPGAKPELIEGVQAMMERQLSHLVHLVDDLLDLSRISRGDIHLQRTALDLQGVVDAAVELARPLIQERRHELTVQRAEGHLPVQGDMQRLTQVLGNLLSNAAKYTEPGGEIRLCADVSGGDAVVRVKDTGLGIPADQLEEIFEMFTQVPEHRAHMGGGGLGIGLALSRQLIELHGGSIEANSEGLGRGSEFVVRLPLAPAAQRPVPPVQGSGDGPVRRRVLVVDDNVDAAASLRMVLSLRGHDVRAVHDGEAALLAVGELAPDVVLLDIGLPRMNGYEIAKRIRAMPNGGRIRLLALTGWGQEEDKRRALEAGFDEHLTKPVDSARLAALIESEK